MTVPINLLPHRTPTQLLAIARQSLDEATRTPGEGMRYAAAHLAALRAAAALLALRAKPCPKERGARVRTVWDLLPEVAPEYAEWATFFSGRTQKRAAAEAGIPRVVTAAEADEMVFNAGQLLRLAEAEVERVR